MTGLRQRGPQRSEPEPSELSLMNALIVLFAPLALLLPAASAEVAERDAAAAGEVAEASGSAHGFDAPAAEPFEVLKEARRPLLLGQVRIEQRVIVRIAPSSRAAR